MLRLLQNVMRGFGRLFPKCVTISQAIAFNMFLAFFPVLLLALGLLSNTSFFHEAMKEIPDRLRFILPPGSADVVAAYFVRKGIHTLRWVSLGLGGTLIAGSQVMVCFMEAFRIVEGEPHRPKYWRLHLRALSLLCLTIVPILAVVILTVFGRQARPWLIQQTGLPHLVRFASTLLYGLVVFVLAVSVLAVLYRIGRPGHRGWRPVLPGALVASVLWWVVDVLFGFYVRKMPYDVIYGGLAAAIGLLLWMYVTAIVVLLGAAYNRETHEFALARTGTPRGVLQLTQRRAAGK